MAKIVGKTLGWVGYGASGLSTNNWHTDNDANLRKIDALLQAGATAIQNTPPASPTEGQVYIVGTAPTGAWASNANAIARYNGVASAWEFFAPAAGWMISVGASDYRWSGTSWVVQDLAHLPGGTPTDTPQFSGLVLTGNILVNQDTNFAANSADGNDQSALTLCGGGSSSITRGAIIQVRGNERPSSGGTLSLAAGDGIQGNIEFSTGGALRATLTKAGEFNVSSGAFRVGSLSGIQAATGGLFRNAVNSDFPGPLSSMAGLANARGFAYNSGAGVVSWSVAIPGQSFTTLGVANFGGAGVSGPAWQIGSDYGVGFGDGRELNWRGGLFNTDAFWGFGQDATLATSFKPMVFKDGANNTWYKLDPNDSLFKHRFEGGFLVNNRIMCRNFTIADDTVNAISAIMTGTIANIGTTLLNNITATQKAGFSPAIGDAELWYTTRYRLGKDTSVMIDMANTTTFRGFTAAYAPINLVAQTNPTSPNEGDIWFTGSELKIRYGGMTRTILTT